MEVTGMIVDGVLIVGYQIKNSRGNVKRISQAQAFQLASAGQLDGVTVQKFRGIEVLTGIDYSTLAHIPAKYRSGEVLQNNGNGTYNVDLDGKEQELTTKEVWSGVVSGTFEGARAGLIGIRKTGYKQVVEFTGNKPRS